MEKRTRGRGDMGTREPKRMKKEKDLLQVISPSPSFPSSPCHRVPASSSQYSQTATTPEVLRLSPLPVKFK
ncbi:MAG: hypothetical protein RMY29_029485 [Nostoc sp. CreGUA01]|nr:hypothetical protein [Nostoc sp. CreGUA01]